MTRKSVFPQSGKLLLHALILVLAFGAGIAKAAIPYEGRALWVTRWDYSSAEDVRKIVQNAASHHFNIILFQVRGEATVYYKSQVEPWAWELSGDSVANCGRNPGWDPLETAVAYAHAAGVELHAYLNVLPAWKQQKSPPQSANHIMTAHRDWLMYDRKGFPMPVTEEIYSFVNPAHPSVKKHLIDLFSEVTENYNIDGVHLDYIRYPIEYKEADLSYDPISLALFRKETNSAPDAQSEAWKQFKTEQINDLIKRIFITVKSKKPNLMLSAACMANYQEGSQKQCQDSLAWLNGGYMDCLMPMNYTSKLELFSERLKTFVTNRQRGLVFMGIQGDRGDEAIRSQIAYLRQCNFPGFGFFSYENLFPNHVPNATARMMKNEIFKTPARVAGRKYPD